MLREDLDDRQRLEEKKAVNHVDILGEGVKAEVRACAKAMGLASSRNGKEAPVAGMELVLILFFFNFFTFIYF